MVSAPSRLTPRVVGFVVALMACGAIGYFVGHSSQGRVFVVGPGWALWSPGGGTAWQGAGTVSGRTPSGFEYSLPPSVPWIDSAGTIHDGNERPACLRLSRIVRVTLETVKYPIAGGYSGTVLWVRC